MPTTIHFIGPQKPFHAEDDFGKVLAALRGEQSVLVRRVGGGAAWIDKAAVAYIEEDQGTAEPLGASGWLA